MLGKRFIFGTIAIICVSIVSAYLRYSGDVYIKLVGAITSLFILSQTITDHKKMGGKNG